MAELRVCVWRHEAVFYGIHGRYVAYDVLGWGIVIILPDTALLIARPCGFCLAAPITLTKQNWKNNVYNYSKSAMLLYLKEIVMRGTCIIISTVSHIHRHVRQDLMPRIRAEAATCAVLYWDWQTSWVPRYRVVIYLTVLPDLHPQLTWQFVNKVVLILIWPKEIYQGDEIRKGRCDEYCFYATNAHLHAGREIPKYSEERCQSR